MKIVSINPAVPLLFEFVLAHPEMVPEGLFAYKEVVGYGSWYGISLRPQSRLYIFKQPMVCCFEGEHVVLYDPKYLSDIQKIVEEYERAYPEKQVEIRVFQP